ncbi:UNVERIFIED_CONTAM: hypothetical protein K2H54_062353 [Gekko kuhli]
MSPGASHSRPGDTTQTLQNSNHGALWAPVAHGKQVSSASLLGPVNQAELEVPQEGVPSLHLYYLVQKDIMLYVIASMESQQGHSLPGLNKSQAPGYHGPYTFHCGA